LTSDQEIPFFVQKTRLIKAMSLTTLSLSIPAAHRIWALIYLLGEISCRSVQFIIRPHLHTHEYWIRYALGVAPNFLAGLYVPACITFVLPYLLQRDATRRDFSPMRYRHAACGIALGGIIGWEYVQTTTRSFFFDPHDIFWTFVGTATFLLILRWRTSPRCNVLKTNVLSTFIFSKKVQPKQA
jgi:hypothetical protein